MRGKMYELKDLTESRMLMEHRILPITIWFVYGLIAIIAVALVWASVGEIDVVVKARGTVRPMETVGTITSKTTGKVKSLPISRDQLVKKGDLLMTIDDSALQLQMNALQVEKEQMSSDLGLANRFIEGIESGRNPFNMKTEESYYYQFEKYKIDNQINNENLELSKDKLSRAQKELTELSKISAWIALKGSPIKNDNSLAASKYRTYALELGELERKGQVDLMQFQSMQTLYKADSVSQQELDLSKRTMESSKIALEQYTQNYSNSLNDRIEALSAAEFEFLNTVAKMMPNMGVGNQINWQTSKDQLVKNLELLGKKIESLQLAVDQCRVEAETAGIYNLAMDFAIGDLVAEGTKIGTIVPESSEVYLAEMALGNQDVGRVKVGDKVKFKLDALPYREYGFVMGDIISISPDAVIDSKSGQSYYKAVATFKNQPMKSYKGVNKFVKVGMSYEAHVVAERKKILWVLMEKLQLSL